MELFGYRIMILLFRVIEFFRPVKPEHLEKYNLKEGESVIDYGCGPGRYIEALSKIVGEKGHVYAVDIQELAVQSVSKRIKKHGIGNVTPVLAEGYTCTIEDNVADKILALDMFHQVSKPGLLFTELHRLIKSNGVLILEDGH